DDTFPVTLLLVLVLKRSITLALHPLSLHDALPISGSGGRARPDRAAPPHLGRGPAGTATGGGGRVPGDGRCPSRTARCAGAPGRSEEHTSELQSRFDIVCRLLLETKKKDNNLAKLG